MMSIYKFSIVTVVYNNVSEIAQTMRSVLSQTFGDYEYIIIDGGSTDGTVEVINSMIHGFHNIRFISEPDKGIYDAMNKAINLANGEWICFMNSGDCFYSSSVLLDVSLQISDSYDVVYGNTNMITKSGFLVDYAKDPSFLLYDMPFCHQSSFVKTSLLRSKYFDLHYKYVADYNFFYNSFIENHRFLRLDLIIATYNTTSGFSASNRLSVFKEVLRVRRPTDSFSRKTRYILVCIRYLLLQKLAIFMPSLVEFLHDLKR